MRDWRGGTGLAATLAASLAIGLVLAAGACQRPAEPERQAEREPSAHAPAVLPLAK
jgi:hypothetical protein